MLNSSVYFPQMLEVANDKGIFREGVYREGVYREGVYREGV